VPREEGGRREKTETDLYEYMDQAAQYYRRMLREHPVAIDYLKGRGLTGEVARDFRVGYAPEGWDTISKALEGVGEEKLLRCGLLTENEQGRRYARFRDRIVFPIRDVRGRVIAFGGRLLGEGKGPKYLNSPETPIFNKSVELYGLFEARRALRSLENVVVVEGYMDVVALAQAGIANAVATLGTANGEPHFRKLYRYTDEVVCCFDGDQAGRQAAWRALENALPALEEGRQLRFMFLPDGEDPDSLVRKSGLEDFRQRLENALPAIEYLFTQLAQGLDLDSIDDRARLASLAAPYIERVPEGILKDLMRARLQKTTGFASRSQVATRETVPLPRPPPPSSEPLHQRMLAVLLKRPGMLQQLESAQVRALLKQTEGTLLADIVSYIDKCLQSGDLAGVESSAILGRWAGSPVHGELIALFERQIPLEEQDMLADLADTIVRLLAVPERHDRARLLNDLQQDPSSIEKLKRVASMNRDRVGLDKERNAD